MFQKEKNTNNICFVWFFSNEFIVNQAIIVEDSPKSFRSDQNYDYGVVLGGFQGMTKEKWGEFIDCGITILFIQLFHSGKIKNILYSNGKRTII